MKEQLLPKKNEEKGFYEIDITDTNSISYKFIALPTRPMVDLVFEKQLYNTNSLKEELVNKIEFLDKDSIIRIKMTNSENLNLLTSSFLKQIVPSSMNYQIMGFRN